MRHRIPHFQHIIGGYAAGYYSYMWSEVMDADAFQAFEETGDIFDREPAKTLHDYIYSAGGTPGPRRGLQGLPRPPADHRGAAGEAGAGASCHPGRSKRAGRLLAQLPVLAGPAKRARAIYGAALSPRSAHAIHCAASMAGVDHGAQSLELTLETMAVREPLAAGAVLSRPGAGHHRSADQVRAGAHPPRRPRPDHDARPRRSSACCHWSTLPLTGSLVMIVIFSGYENFVSKIDHTRIATGPSGWARSISRR